MKRKGDTTTADTEIFTIKCGLSAFCRQRELREKIEQDVVEMSDFIVEDLYENAHLVIDDKPTFLDYFYHLKAKSKEQKYKIDPQYNNIRSRLGLQKYNVDYRSNLMVSASTQYETVLRNNITVHMYNRVRRFFKFVAKDIPSYETLDRLFNKNSTQTVHPQLLDHLKQHLQFEFEDFYDLKQKWYKYIPFLYRMQRFFESNNVHNFRIFPIFQHGRKHLRYDSQALWQLLCSLRMQQDLTSWKKFAPEKAEVWSRYFDIPKFETSNHKFDYSFTTDGVSACLSMTRPCKTAPQPSTKRTAASIRAKYTNGDYEHIIGIDPGLKLMFGIVRKHIHQETSRGTPVKMKSSKFRQDSGENRRKYTHKRWTKHVQDEVERDRHAQEVPISCLNIF